MMKICSPCRINNHHLCWARVCECEHTMKDQLEANLRAHSHFTIKKDGTIIQHRSVEDSGYRRGGK